MCVVVSRYKNCYHNCDNLHKFRAWKGDENACSVFEFSYSSIGKTVNDLITELVHIGNGFLMIIKHDK